MKNIINLTKLAKRFEIKQNVTKSIEFITE